MVNQRRERYGKHIDFVLFDILVFHFSFVMAYFLKFGHLRSPYFLPGWRNIVFVMTTFNIVIVLYSPFLGGILRRGHLKELLSLIKQSALLVLLAFFYLSIINRGPAGYRSIVLMSGAFFVVFDFIVRYFWKKLLKRKLLQKKLRYAVIGEGSLADRVKASLAADEFARFEVDAALPGAMSALPRLKKMLEQNVIDVVVIVQEDPEVFNGTVALCEKYGCRVYAVPFYVDALSANTQVEQMGDVKLLSFRACPLDSLYNALIKRTFDIIASVILIIVTSPIMLVAAIGTKLSSPGPILFRQVRVGQYRKPFTMLKFRSMRVTDTETTGWSTDDDARKTPFGSLIRKVSLDELPQLFNVFKGDMSLVGPRPEIPFHVEHFKEEIPMYLVRQQVRPGITGWAQINGLRGDTDIAERVKYDIWYIENWSIGLDIKIILNTPRKMINSEKIVK